MNHIVFEHISFLYLGGFFLLAYFILRSTTSLRRFSPSFLRIVILILIALALAEPYQEQSLDHQSVNLLVDVSSSMDIDVLQKEIAKTVQSLQAEKWNYKIIPFAGTLGEPTTDIQNSEEKLDRKSSRLENAVARLMEESSDDILLFTDGIETQGSVLENVQEARAGGVRIYPQVSSEFQKSAERVVLEDLLLPLKRTNGEVVRGSVSFVSSKREPQEGQLFVFQNGELLSSEEITIESHRSLTKELEIPYSGSPKDKVEVRFVPKASSADGAPGDIQTRSWFIHSDEGKKVLLLGKNSGDNQYLRKTFEEANLKVSEAIKSDVSDANVLGEYEAIVINNLAYRDLPRLIREEAKTFVEHGGRFLLVGGDHSFGLGGYVGTEIDSMMPVASLKPRKELKRVNVAVQLVLDKSASMKYGQKIEFSKQAAREVVRSLKDPDYFGVVGFDTTPFIAFPIRRLAEYRSMAIQRIGTLYAAGKTNLFPALDEARRGLLNVPAGRKHVIVLTDGKIPDEGPHYLQLVQQMRVRGITVSTVMMGSEADTRLLRNIAQYGGGSFYQTKDPRSLPRIFLSDVQVSTKEKTMKENEEYRIRRSRTAKQFSTSLLSFPPLRGIVETKPRRDEYIELVATGGGNALPLLATRTFGAGKTIAFTSDAIGRWSSSWITWASFRQFWMELVHPIGKKGDGVGEALPLDFDLRWFRAGGGLTLDLVIYNQVPGAVSMLIQKGDGEKQSYLPEEVAEGRYQLKLEGSPSGVITVSGNVGKKSFGPLSLDISDDEYSEERPVGVQMVLLSQLARGTGGEVNGYPKRSSLKSKKQNKQISLVPYFLFFAFLCLFFDVVLRTIGGIPFRKRI